MNEKIRNYRVQGSGDRVQTTPVKSFKDLLVWKKAYGLSLFIYKVTSKFPKSELYGIVSQMRRASVSVVSNIAEGYSRKGRAEYIQFLSVAYGSLSELETQILLSKDLAYIKEEEYNTLMKSKDEAGAMLYRLLQKLQGTGYRVQGTGKIKERFSEPFTLYSESCTLNPEPCKLNPEPCTLSPERGAK